MKERNGWHRLGVVLALAIGVPSACVNLPVLIVGSSSSIAVGAAVAGLMAAAYAMCRGIGWVVAGFARR